ncbi:CDP-alcohol phosphatidyltransferase family protein [Patescibacteria group bacterium]|nr:CDP-alcohol phosphatidyltransferase family protein [Patescibacteria group bacterium]
MSESIKEFRNICQKTAPNPKTETLEGRFNRIFSIYLVKLFIKTDITPNQITVISVFVFLLGVGFFLIDDYSLRIVGILLVVFSAILDACDGEVARYKKNSSIVGMVYTEPVSHDIQYTLMFMPISIGFFLETGNAVFLILGFLATSFKMLYRIMDLRYWAAFKNYAVLDKKSDKDSIIKDDSMANGWNIKDFFSWLYHNFYTSTGMITPLFILTIFDRIEIFLWFYGVSFPLLWIYLFLKQLKLLRNIK